MGTLVGRSRLWERRHDEMKSVIVAGAVIINERQETLCALRSAVMSMPGLWEFPGGKLEPGETAAACLVREIEEELGCTIQVGALIEDTVHDYPHLRVRLITHFATIQHGFPVPREHEKLIWLPASELDGLNWAPADIPTVKRLTENSAH
jgi:8-oxo-dGTP diphosphatase